MKIKVANCIRECYIRGWISPRDGNVSYKSKDNKYYYITPGAVRKSEVQEEDILKIDLYNNKILENKSNLKASGEIILHNLILRDEKHKDKNLSVIHCHPPHILAFIGMLKVNRELNDIRKVFPEIDQRIKIGKNVPYIEARTAKLGETTYKNILNNSIVGLKQHGVVSVGETFQDAIENIETLEYYCKIFLMEK